MCYPFLFWFHRKRNGKPCTILLKETDHTWKKTKKSHFNFYEGERIKVQMSNKSDYGIVVTCVHKFYDHSKRKWIKNEIYNSIVDPWKRKRWSHTFKICSTKEQLLIVTSIDEEFRNIRMMELFYFKISPKRGAIKKIN